MINNLSGHHDQLKSNLFGHFYNWSDHIFVALFSNLHSLIGQQKVCLVGHFDKLVGK